MNRRNFLRAMAVAPVAQLGSSYWPDEDPAVADYRWQAAMLLQHGYISRETFLRRWHIEWVDAYSAQVERLRRKEE